MTKKFHPCETCKVHRTTAAVCAWCLRDDKVSASKHACALCGQEFHSIGSRRHGSPYCSLTCVSLLTEARTKALAKVAAAVKSGLIVTARWNQCVDCGNQADHYDHRNYMRPLSVQPVCRSCNKKRGPALDIRELVSDYLGIDASEIRNVIKNRQAVFQLEAA